MPSSRANWLYVLFDYLLDVPLPLGLFEAFVES
jgi:hypothetical protein